MTKTVSLRAARASLQAKHPFIPPITGYGGNATPVANSFDATGNFRSRDRVWSSSKRARSELDAAFDLSQQYPPLAPPEKTTLNLESIKGLLVSAVAFSSEVIPLCDRDDTSPEMKSMCHMLVALMRVVEGVVENGLIPLSAAATSTPGGRGPVAIARRQSTPPVAAPKPPPPGKAELVEALEKADKESIVFGANLGRLPLANRSELSTNFSVDLLKKTEDKNAGLPPASLNEATRIVEDALSCCEKMEFLGARSRKFINNRDENDPANGTFATMPVRLAFSDKDSRLNFERAMRECCDVRAVQSLPEKIRKEMAAFKSAMDDRYPDMIISVRPDSASCSFLAFKKKDKERKWVQCSEKYKIPYDILLDNYRSKPVVLEPIASASESDVFTGASGDAAMPSDTQ
jgi:hypothetical protein